MQACLGRKRDFLLVSLPSDTKKKRALYSLKNPLTISTHNRTQCAHCLRENMFVQFCALRVHPALFSRMYHSVFI